MALMKKSYLIAAVVVLVAAGGGYAWWSQRANTDAVQYRTAALTRGSLQASVAASGNVNPVSQVSVGTQVSGQVRAVLAGWGASVVPELLVRGLIDDGQLVNLVPDVTLPVNLYWHCWNLDSVVIDRLTAALAQAASSALASSNKTT